MVTVFVVNISVNRGYVNILRTTICEAFSRTLHATTDSTVDISTDVAFGFESWKLGYKTCKKEAVEALEGAPPVDLEGTYYRNGLGKFESGRVKILHPFDADGMVAAVTMKVSFLQICYLPCQRASVLSVFAMSNHYYMILAIHM